MINFLVKVAKIVFWPVSKPQKWKTRPEIVCLLSFKWYFHKSKVNFWMLVAHKSLSFILFCNSSGSFHFQKDLATSLFVMQWLIGIPHISIWCNPLSFPGQNYCNCRWKNANGSVIILVIMRKISFLPSLSVCELWATYWNIKIADFAVKSYFWLLFFESSIMAFIKKKWNFLFT